MATAEGSPGRSNGMRRRVEATAVGELLLGLPAFLASLVVVHLAAAAATGTRPGAALGWAGYLVVAAWLASGVVMLWRPSEDVLTRVLFRLDRPRPSDERKLYPAWEAVTERAGVDGTRYTLWVEESDEINALAAAGHTVAVTRRALDTLPPQYLEAVLAHELGHHLGGHALASAMSYWYSLPGRLAVRLVLWLARAVAVLYRAVLRFIRRVFPSQRGAAVLVGVLLWCIGVFVTALFAVYLVPFLLISPVLAWVGRRSELQADRTAARLGYGPALIEVFQGWQAMGVGQRRGRMARLLSTHPSMAARIAELRSALGPGWSQRP